MAQLQPLNTFATAGVASLKVLAGNGARSNATFVNDSQVVIYLSKGQAAVVGSGIALYPGGVHNMAQIANGGPIWQGDIYAIAKSANSNLTILEEYN